MSEVTRTPACPRRTPTDPGDPVAAARPGGRRAGLAVVGVLAYLPYLAYSGTTDTLTNFFVLLTMASMWNLLAGYAGMVSVGQQAYIGLGAYFVLFLAQHGVEPFVAIPLATLGCAVIAIPISLLVLRLRGRLLRDRHVGGGRRLPPGAAGPRRSAAGPGAAPRLRRHGTRPCYGGHVLGVAGGGGRRARAVYLLLRGRLGLVLTAMRDNEVGARSPGARVHAGPADRVPGRRRRGAARRGRS